MAYCTKCGKDLNDEIFVPHVTTGKDIYCLKCEGKARGI